MYCDICRKWKVNQQKIMKFLNFLIKIEIVLNSPKFKSFSYVCAEFFLFSSFKFDFTFEQHNIGHLFEKTDREE